MTQFAQAPTIETPRLRLRHHRIEDLEVFATFYASDRAIYVDPPRNPSHLWYGFASEVGSWSLVGQGGWAIETHDGALVGQVAITQPPHFPEREIGWTAFDGFEGKGLVFEAASAALAWAWDQGFDTLVSYIDPKNQRSIALATRLGAVHDPDAALPLGDTAEDTVVYRHSPDADGGPEAYA